MIEIIIWLGSLLCPNPYHTVDNHGNCNLVHISTTSSSTTDTGGETGGNPTPPPPPPPPPIGG